MRGEGRTYSDSYGADCTPCVKYEAYEVHTNGTVAIFERLIYAASNLLHDRSS